MADFDLFDVFWNEYPRHVAKKAARKAWDKIVTTEELANQAIDAIRLQVKTIWRTKDKTFIPHASTWLHGERWEDEIEQTENADTRAAKDFASRKLAETLLPGLPDVRKNS